MKATRFSLLLIAHQAAKQTASEERPGLAQGVSAVGVLGSAGGDEVAGGDGSGGS